MKSSTFFFRLGIAAGLLAGLVIGLFLARNFFELLNRLLSHF